MKHQAGILLIGVLAVGLLTVTHIPRAQAQIKCPPFTLPIIDNGKIVRCDPIPVIPRGGIVIGPDDCIVCGSIDFSWPGLINTVGNYTISINVFHGKTIDTVSINVPHSFNNTIQKTSAQAK